MTSGLAVEVVDLDGAVRLHEAWVSLAGRSLEPNIFAEPAFALPAARHLGGRVPPLFFAVWRSPRGSADLVALCLVAPPRWPLRAMANAWMHKQATAAFPLLDRAEAMPAFAALRAALARLPGAPAALLLTGIDRDGPTAELIRSTAPRARFIDERTRAVLIQDGSREHPAFRAGKELRRLRRRLTEQGSLTVTSASRPDDVKDATSQFLALEARGWKGRRGTALGSDTQLQGFVEAMLGSLASDGQCRMDGLALDNRPIAMGIVLRSGHRDYFWKTAYDETYARFSPGLQLVSDLTIRQLRDPSVALTDSCAVPGHSMIDRMWPDRITVADVMVPLREVEDGAFDRACAREMQHRWLRERAKSWLRRRRS